MLDIQFIRENPDMVQEKSKQKGYEVDVKKLISIDTDRRTRLTRIEDLRRRRNDQADAMKSGKPSEEQLAAGKQLKEEITQQADELQKIESDYQALLKSVPNMPLDDVPVGLSESENKVTKTVGEKKHFDFAPKPHWEIAEPRGLIDKERAAKIAGSRFAYLKGDLVRLQFAVVQFVLQNAK